MGVLVELYLQVKMNLHLLFLLFTGVVFAPFPKQHQLNWKNPFIDPIWEKLDKETKKAVYDEWLEKEPTKKAMMDYYEASDRRKTADAVAWEQAKQLLKVKIEKEEHSEKIKKVKTENRYKTPSQVHWEDFMAAFQFALHIRMAEKRALYQYFLAHARKHGKKKKKNEKEMQYTKQLVKDKIKDTYLKFINKYEEKLYKVWTKAEELKENIKKYESGYNQQANYNYY